MITKTAKIALVFLLLVSAGCVKMKTDTEIIDFGSDKTSQTFTLTTHGNMEWSITSTDAWVTVNPDKGQAGSINTITFLLQQLEWSPL